MVSFDIFLVAYGLFFQYVLAHPGHDHTAEVAQRTAYMRQAAKRSLVHCAASLKARGVQERSHLRRRQLADSLRKKRSISAGHFLRARDLNSSLAISHHSNRTGLSISTPDNIIFSGNSSAILNPEFTEGPYYVLGELVRQNVTEGQAGVPLTVDIQIIDINTCLPVPKIVFDFWHCNSTGVYSGVISGGNGNSNDSTNLDKTFLRGIQSSDSEGVVQVHSIFPGHYIGRTPHIHILGHINATIAANATLSTAGRVAHVGQMFFDQDLIAQVEKTYPYNTNTQSLTLNVDDRTLVESAENVDPMMEYVLLGNKIEDGILAWTTIGINGTSNYNVSAAATHYASGGVANPNPPKRPCRPGGPCNRTSPPPILN